MSASSFLSPWPDPKSSVLSKIDFGVPLSDLLLWLQLRDIFFGKNNRKQSFTKALALAQDCKHPDAVWLSSVCKDVSSIEQAREVFLSHQDDARALCFAWLLSDRTTVSHLRRASELGYAFACSLLCGEIRENDPEEAFQLAQLASLQHERDGFYWLGLFSRDGVACEEDIELAREHYLISAELGDVESAEDYGLLLAESNPVRWFWHQRAALHGEPYSFLGSFSQQVRKYFSGSGNAKVVYLIGQGLKGNIDTEKKELFGECYNFDILVNIANQAVLFYEAQIKSARLAVDTFTMIATRFHLIKDMRIYIGKLIWEGRVEADYMI